MADMIVVDASVMVDVLAEEAGQGPLSVELAVSGELFAPSILPTECMSALWRLDRAGVITEAQSRGAIGALAHWPVTLVDPQILVERAWRHRHSVRIADAFYVACAELLELPLLTSDRRLARAATGVEVRLA